MTRYKNANHAYCDVIASTGIKENDVMIFTLVQHGGMLTKMSLSFVLLSIVAISQSSNATTEKSDGLNVTDERLIYVPTASEPITIVEKDDVARPHDTRDNDNIDDRLLKTLIQPFSQTLDGIHVHHFQKRVDYTNITKSLKGHKHEFFNHTDFISNISDEYENETDGLITNEGSKQYPDTQFCVSLWSHLLGAVKSLFDIFADTHDEGEPTRAHSRSKRDAMYGENGKLYKVATFMQAHKYYRYDPRFYAEGSGAPEPEMVRTV